MQRNDPFEYAEVCKGLSQLESEGTLRHTDRTHLNRSIEFLADELAYALDKTPDYARMLIVKAAATTGSPARNGRAGAQAGGCSAGRRDVHDPVAVEPVEAGSAAQAVGADLPKLEVIARTNIRGQLHFAR